LSQRKFQFTEKKIERQKVWKKEETSVWPEGVGNRSVTLSKGGKENLPGYTRTKERGYEGPAQSVSRPKAERRSETLLLHG